MSLECYECSHKLTLREAIKRFIYNYRVYKAREALYYQTQIDYQNLRARHNDFLDRIGNLASTQRDLVKGFNDLASQVNMIAERLNSPAKRQKKQHD